MKRFRENIWKEEEYEYRAAYGFVPNIQAYIHDETEIRDGSDSSDRDCMLIVPGGGYCMCVPHEGGIPAKVFYEQGMNVFVLSYTTDITMSVPLKSQPMEDISRAVRFIRKHELEYGIKGRKLVACGFSAGAHVVGSLAVHYGEIVDKDPKLKEVSNRPDGVILSYPVITTGEFTHGYSVQTLLGKNPASEELEYYSLEKQVTEATPPCFIWQTATDDLVPIENSYLMAEALRKHNVPYAHYVFPTGFHGLSVPNDDFFGGWNPDKYTMEQVFRAVEAVKRGEGIDVSEQRVQELKDQFPDADENASDSKDNKDSKEPENDPEQMGFVIDKTLGQDVGLWPELARVWMNRL